MAKRERESEKETEKKLRVFIRKKEVDFVIYVQRKRRSEQPHDILIN